MPVSGITNVKSVGDYCVQNMEIAAYFALMALWLAHPYSKIHYVAQPNRLSAFHRYVVIWQCGANSSFGSIPELHFA